MISFEKYHGNGNDFVFIESSALNLFSSVAQLQEFVIRACSRNFGIGADGVVFCNTSQNEVLILNSDGSFAATCGNALRCYGLKLLLDGLWDGKSSVAVKRLVPVIFQEYQFESSEAFLQNKNDVFATLLQGNLQTQKICVAMGAEHATQIHSISKNDFNLEQCVYVQLANPHLVFIEPAFEAFHDEQFKQLGKWAQGELVHLLAGVIPVCNISMLYLKSGTWYLQVYERGAGLTLCCGSGAVASRVALEALQLVNCNEGTISFNLKGGGVDIGSKEQRTLTGSAECVYKGSISWY
ncbi:MAG: diaminopimelate epimerase [Bdellovibrionota bacterium]